MAADTPDGTYIYTDADLSFPVPSYLRPKKGMRFFSTRGKRDRRWAVFTMAVELPNEDLAAAMWSTIMNAKPSEWMGVRQRIIRRGRAAYLRDGLELLMSGSNSANDEVHSYHVFFLAGPHRVYVSFGGQGDIQRFDSVCRGIVSEMRVRGETPAPEMRQG